MNCSEAEKLIYLYRELDKKELRSLDLHMIQCPACGELLKEVQRMQIGIEQLGHSPVAPLDSERLSDRIMDGIRSGKPSRRTPVLSWFNLLRYGLAAFSLILIITFYAQYNIPAEIPQKMADTELKNYHPGGSMELRSSSDRISLAGFLNTRGLSADSFKPRNRYETK